jgi:hypothetical protein
LTVHTIIHQFHNNPRDNIINWQVYNLKLVLGFYQIHIQDNQNTDQERGKIFIPII